MSRSPNEETRKTAKVTQAHVQRASFVRYAFWIAILAAALYSIFGASRQAETISYTQFKKEVSEGNVAQVTMQGNEVNGVYREGNGTGEKGEEQTGSFATALPPLDDPELIRLLEDNGVTVKAEPRGQLAWGQLLVGLLPWLFLLGLFLYISRSMQRQMAGGGPGGIFQFTKSKARKYRRGSTDVKFDDVAGLENAKGDIQQITDYLKAPERYRRIGAKLPRGVLLLGPPGTGKTLLAKAAAGEADVPFYSISGSEFIEMLVGVGASRVRDLFENAKNEAPAIIFIDEIDSVGRSRGTGLGGGHDEREQTLNQILSEMDGFSPEQTVVVLAATNRPDVLDSALLRPGRFDRKILLELPRKEARKRIFEIHTRKVRLADDVNLEVVAKRTAGFSGADIKNLVNEAALLAGRGGSDQISMETFEKARDKIVLGAERELTLKEEDKRRIAFHESGHALLTCLLPNTDPLEKVTIIPRGRTLGATEQVPEERRHNLSQSYLKDRISVMLGGRVAEKIVFREVSSGAEDDLRQVTSIARRMISRWGMSEELGPVSFRRDEHHVFLGREMTQPRDFSEHTAQLIDEEVRVLVREIEEETAKILQRHREHLEALAEALLEKEILTRDQITELVERQPIHIEN